MLRPLRKGKLVSFVAGDAVPHIHLAALALVVGVSQAAALLDLLGTLRDALVLLLRITQRTFRPDIQQVVSHIRHPIDDGRYLHHILLYIKPQWQKHATRFQSPSRRPSCCLFDEKQSISTI